MANGYTRQEAANITTAATIEASHFNNEYNTIEDAMDAASGHNHDGTTGGGAQIPLTSAVTGVLPVANGGTALSSTPTNGQLLIGDGVDYTLATLTQGTGITITNGAGSITVAASGGDPVTSAASDSGTASPASNVLTIAGGEGIDTSATGSTVTITGEDATTSNKGIASFATADFSVSSGAVSLSDAAVKSVAGDSGTATPSGHSFTISGGTGLTSAGVGSTITLNIDTAGVGASELADNIQIEGYRPIVTNSGTSITLALTDADSYVRLTGGTAVTVTVPPNSSVAFNIGTEIDVIWAGVGQPTFAEGAGVTINSKDSNLAISAQYGAATLKKVATNEWDLIGDLA